MTHGGRKRLVRKRIGVDARRQAQAQLADLVCRDEHLEVEPVQINDVEHRRAGRDDFSHINQAGGEHPGRRCLEDQVVPHALRLGQRRFGLVAHGDQGRHFILPGADAFQAQPGLGELFFGTGDAVLRRIGLVLRHLAGEFHLFVTMSVHRAGFREPPETGGIPLRLCRVGERRRALGTRECLASLGGLNGQRRILAQHRQPGLGRLELGVQNDHGLTRLL